jgi:hypothetical protein
MNNLKAHHDHFIPLPLLVVFSHPPWNPTIVPPSLCPAATLEAQAHRWLGWYGPMGDCRTCGLCQQTRCSIISRNGRSIKQTERLCVEGISKSAVWTQVEYKLVPLIVGDASAMKKIGAEKKHMDCLIVSFFVTKHPGTC